MKWLWLARHAEANVARGVAVGWSDPDLSTAGRDQARSLGRDLSDLPLGRIVSSDLLRAQATAAELARWHGLVVELDPRLREIDFGAWEGQRLARLWVEAPAEAAAWEGDLRRTPSGFGESFGQMEGRIRTFYADLIRDGRESHGTLVVSHRGPLAVLAAMVESISVEESWRQGFPLATARRAGMSVC